MNENTKKDANEEPAANLDAAQEDEYEDINPEFHNEREIIAMLPKVYRILKEVLETYMDLDPESEKLLLAWIMAAPYFRSFYAFPYLFINASKASGKTRLLKLINALLPNSIMVASLSESSLFRSKEIKDCILIDEAERLHSMQKENLLDLLNSGYKKGGKVLRVEGDKVKKVREFDVYGPIVLANIWGLDSVLEDRCLTIILQKTDNQAIIRIPEFFDLDPRIRAINRFMGESVSSVGSYLQGINSAIARAFLYNQAPKGAGSAGFGKDVGKKDKKEIVSVDLCTIDNTNNPTLPTHTYTTNEETFNFEAVQDVQVSGREFELWLPLLEITYTLSCTADNSIFLDIKKIANSRSETKKVEEAEQDRDTDIALSMHAYILQNRPEWLSLSEFIKTQSPNDWLRPEWLGRFIKRTRILKEYRRARTGGQYKINLAALEHYLKVRGIVDADLKSEAAVRQPALGPQTHLDAQNSSKIEPSKETSHTSSVGEASAAAGLNSPTFIPPLPNDSSSHAPSVVTSSAATTEADPLASASPQPNNSLSHASLVTNPSLQPSEGSPPLGLHSPSDGGKAEAGAHVAPAAQPFSDPPIIAYLKRQPNFEADIGSIAKALYNGNIDETLRMLKQYERAGDIQSPWPHLWRLTSWLDESE